MKRAFSSDLVLRDLKMNFRWFGVSWPWNLIEVTFSVEGENGCEAQNETLIFNDFYRFEATLELERLSLKVILQFKYHFKINWR